MKIIHAVQVKQLRAKYRVPALPDGEFFGAAVYRLRNHARGTRRANVAFVVSGGEPGVAHQVYAVRSGDLDLLCNIQANASIRRLWCRITTVSYSELEAARKLVREYERQLEDLSAFAKAVKLVKRRGYKLVARSEKERLRRLP
jgi:hypothetical protein